jgi:hypothetical protein
MDRCLFLIKRSAVKNKLLIIAMAMSRTAFIVWEILDQQWINEGGDAPLRIDLIFLLPGLLGITLYTIFQMREDKK